MLTRRLQKCNFLRAPRTALKKRRFRKGSNFCPGGRGQKKLGETEYVPEKKRRPNFFSSAEFLNLSLSLGTLARSQKFTRAPSLDPMALVSSAVVSRIAVNFPAAPGAVSHLINSPTFPRARTNAASHYWGGAPEMKNRPDAAQPSTHQIEPHLVIFARRFKVSTA